MNAVDELLARISVVRGELHDRFTVRRIGIFGSYVRGSQRPDSDIDVIVVLEKPTFDNFMELKFRLEELLGRPIDLVIADTVKPRIQPVIEREAVYV
ncbi:MAG: nucleotidyltransferase family protein [Nitrospirae bacterium]|nr:nucleotidyltransferase family protein [Nitrospirota bacterium]